MRIAYVVLLANIAGGETVCLQQMRAARKRGHTVCILVPAFGSTMETAQREGFEAYILPLERTFHLHKAFSLGSFLKAWHADLLHTHTLLSGMVLARLGAWLAGIPLICHAHSPNVFSRNLLIRNIQRVLDQITQPFCQVMVAVSEDTKQRLIQQGNPSTIEVIPNGVVLPKQEDYIALERFRSCWGINNTVKVICCVARLEHNKGQHDLVLAAAQIELAAIKTQIRYLLIGNDPLVEQTYFHELQQLAREKQISDRFVFTGFQPNASDLVSGFDIFVLPSYREAMPMSILEAMAAAKPVVATNVNGIPEVVVDGITGFLVPPGDPNALAEAILKLLRDPELAHNMGQAGRLRVQEHFDLDKLHERVFELYEKVTAKRHG